jgi:hypothetical protein
MGLGYHKNLPEHFLLEKELVEVAEVPEIDLVLLDFDYFEENYQ